MTGDNIIAYSYINNNFPEEKINYSYSKFGGENFLLSWKKNRMLVKTKSIELEVLFPKTSLKTEILFIDWIRLIKTNQFQGINDLLLLIKRFEVTKKIYSDYDDNFRPIGSKEYSIERLYLLFALLLTESYIKFQKIQMLNSLLKILDLCISIRTSFSEEELTILGYCTWHEDKFIKELQLRLK